jgi:hypothetical protein
MGFMMIIYIQYVIQSFESHEATNFNFPNSFFQNTTIYANS